MEEVKCKETIVSTAAENKELIYECLSKADTIFCTMTGNKLVEDSKECEKPSCLAEDIKLQNSCLKELYERLIAITEVLGR